MSIDEGLSGTYLFAAAVSIWRGSRIGFRSNHGRPGVWAYAALILVVFSYLKIARVGPIFAHLARQGAQKVGLYEHHFAFQILGIAALFLAAMVASRCLAQSQQLLTFRTAAVALSLLGLLIWVAIRVSSIHTVDRLMGAQIGVFTVSQVGELCFLFAIVTCAICPTSRTLTNH